MRAPSDGSVIAPRCESGLVHHRHDDFTFHSGIIALSFVMESVYHLCSFNPAACARSRTISERHRLPARRYPDCRRRCAHVNFGEMPARFAPGMIWRERFFIGLVEPVACARRCRARSSRIRLA